jgi:hypothetical protein
MCVTVAPEARSRDPAAVVGGESNGLEVQEVGVRLAADRVEERVAVYLLAALERRDDPGLLVVAPTERTFSPRRKAAPHCRMKNISESIISRSTKSRMVARASITVT